jgi:two-component system, chemotaxis family, chemotaxis protein CheY
MKTCLLVDDSNIIRKMSSFVLKKHGFEVIEAEDGLAAQKILLEKLPDVMIMDWSMPNMDGMELLKWVRSELKAVAKPLIIFCTSQNDSEKIQEAILAGANEYIIKPFTAEIIKNKLELLGLIENEIEFE